MKNTLHKTRQVTLQKTLAAALMLALSALGTVSAQAQASQSAADRADKDTTRGNLLLANNSESYEGMWQGMLRTPTGMRRVAFDVARRPMDESLIANVITSAQKPYSVLVDTFRADDHHVQLKMKISGCAFEGDSNSALTEIRGTWIQDGQSLPLTLKRVVVTPRSERGLAYAAQNQTAGTLRDAASSNNNETPSDSVRPRHEPAFRIGPPHWFSWREWSPWIGNQEVPYGTYYW